MVVFSATGGWRWRAGDDESSERDQRMVAMNELELEGGMSEQEWIEKGGEQSGVFYKLFMHRASLLRYTGEGDAFRVRQSQA